ncbi:MAG: mandelate racemase/muconate lactonizing enzyme family protein [Gemmatimonadota bacterium]|nr:mandelate racemase/muconate lactonizing enzyme family protein [Gemmatimonadota bacterium]
MSTSQTALNAKQSFHRAARIKDIKLTWVKLPLRPLVKKHLMRQNYHYSYSEICEVTLDCGIVGFGETMPFYTWGWVSDHSIQRAMGKNAIECMWDDTLGPGLQQALFDAVGKLFGVPVHSLIGSPVRQDVPLSWWAIDMPGDEWAEECHTALEHGYISMKVKGRPWYDPQEQLQTIEKSVPSYFRISIDFNGTLLGTQRAVEILKNLSRFPHTDMFEEPMPAGIWDGYRELVRCTWNPIVLHCRLRSRAKEDKLPILSAAQERICNGFVVSDGGATSLKTQAAVLAELGVPFWLQMLGSGVTASFLLHMATTMTHAEWPSVTCHQLYDDELIDPPLVVRDGKASVSDRAGLGVELNYEAVERHRIEPIRAMPYPMPGQLVGVRWPSGGTSYYTHRAQYWQDFSSGRLPSYVEGVRLDVIPNDGTKSWAELQKKAVQGGVHLADSPI